MNIFAIILTFLASHSSNLDSIAIEHVGISDKPIPAIVIFKAANRGLLNQGEYSTDIRTFEKLVSMIKSSKTSEEADDNEFGTFSFTVNESGQKMVSYMSRKNSTHLFDKLVKELALKKGNDSLINALKNITKRVN